MLRKIQHFLELIRFSHTVFALPFALLSAVIAWNMPGSEFRWRDLIGILVCMVTARSAAMAFNRLVDRNIDDVAQRIAAHPAEVLADAVEDNDRVVGRIAAHREDRGDDIQRQVVAKER